MKAKRIYFGVGGISLIIVAGLKLMEVAGGGEYLKVPDPVVNWMGTGELLIYVAILELAIAMCALSGKSFTIKGWSFVGFAVVALGYRGALKLVPGDRGCGCMGNLGDYINLSETFIGLLSGGLLLYLLLGGVAVVTLDYIGAKGRNEELMVDRSGASEKTAGAR